MTTTEPRALARALHLAGNGRRASLPAQLVHQALHILPQHIASRPNSLDFRTALAALVDDGGRGLCLMPTRREVFRALDELERLGELPEWVDKKGPRR